MRLIDADELKKVICNAYDCEIGLLVLIDLINNAPTVEVVDGLPVNMRGDNNG